MNFRNPVIRKALICSHLLNAFWPLTGFGQADTNLVEIRDGWFYRNGEKTFIKGVCFLEHHWVVDHLERSSLDVMAYEFDRIREAGFNTIRTILRPEELAVARAHGLLVVQGANNVCFSREYLDAAYVENAVNETRTTVNYSKAYDNILYYLVDNEPSIMDGIYRQGVGAAEQFHRTLVDAAKSADPFARVSVSTYPPASILDYSVFDVVSLNLYPLCPWKDSVGYRGHAEWFKREFAADKPLIISEFGQAVGDGEENMCQMMIDCLDDQIAAGAVGSFFFLWRTFVDEARPDNGWIGMIPNWGASNDYTNAPRPVYYALQQYFEAVVIEPKKGACYTNVMPVSVYGSDRTGSMSIEVGNETFPLERTGTYWWTGHIPVTPSGSEAVVVEARDTQDMVLVRKTVPVHFVDRLQSVTLNIEPETNQLAEGESCRVRIAAFDQDGQPVPNRVIRVGINESGRDLWTSLTKEVMTDSEGSYRFVWESPLPGFVTVVAGALPDGGICPVRADVCVTRVDRPSLANLLADPGFETTEGSPWSFSSSLPVFVNWAARSGSSGVGVAGWVAPTNAEVSQIVPVTNGMYTFALWVREEGGYNAQQCFLRLDWLDADDAAVAASTIRHWTSLPQDGGWHPVFVTGSCSSPELAAVRVVFHTSFGWMRSDPCSLMIDDAMLSPGEYGGADYLANEGFEVGSGDGWTGTSWYTVPNGSANGRKNWACHSGGWGVGLEGWQVSSNGFTAVLCQNLAPGTGTYTFSACMLREPNFLLTNAEVRLGWYDSTCTNKIQPDCMTRFTLPPDGVWHRYSVTGSCFEPALHEVRAVIAAQYTGNPDEVIGRGMKIDDARFSKLERDTDADLLPDTWERDYFDSITSAEPDADDDGDGQNNYQEFVAGTDPKSSFSVLALAPAEGEGRTSLDFDSSRFHVYALQRSTNLCRDNLWTDVQSHVEGEGGTMSMTDTSKVSQGYYRLGVSREH